MIASRRIPRPDSSWSTAPARIQVSTVAPNAVPAPANTGRRLTRFAPRKLAVTAARIRIASRPSRNTIIDVLKTTVPWLSWPRVASVGSCGPVFAVAMR